MSVYTLTLNPAFDVHANAQELALQRENIVNVTSRDAGGKGVNVSRALSVCGVESTAMLLLGKENQDDFLACLGNELKIVSVAVPGRIRENLTIHEKGRAETRISFSGFTAVPEILEEIAGKLNTVTAGDIVSLNGSLSEGIEKESLKALLRSLKERGAFPRNFLRPPKLTV